jgi:hypothetical protein
MPDIAVERGDLRRTFKIDTISDGVSGQNTLIAAVTGKRLKVYALVLISEGTVGVEFRDGASTALTGRMNFQAREGLTIAVAPPAFLLQTTAGNAFTMNLDAAVQIDGWFAYWDDDPA